VILTLCTAEETLNILLCAHGRILEFASQARAGRMNETMAPVVAAMLDRHTDTPATPLLAAVACVRGPGSFTGVRLGLAFATGLCLARQIPLAGLDYLPPLAASAPDGFDEIHVITHSRANKVYHQSFQPPVRPLAAPTVLTPARDLATQAARAIIADRASTCRVAVLGSGLTRNPQAFADLDKRATRLSIENPTPQALLAATQTARYDGPPIDALYLRGSDAEENLAAIAKGRGLTEAEARMRMERALK